MLKNGLRCGVLLTAASVGMLMFAQDSQAQRFGGRGLGGVAGFGGNWGGFGYPGYYGGYGMGNSVHYGNWGNPGYYGSSGWGTVPYANAYTYPGASYGYGNVNYNWNSPSSAFAPGTSNSYQSFYPPQNNAAHVTVRVPDQNAQVWFNDTQMPERGVVREFNTPALDSATKDYHYTVRARWMQGDQSVERTRTVHVHPGQQTTVDFIQDQSGNTLQNQPRNNTRPAGNLNQQPQNLSPNPNPSGNTRPAGNLNPQAPNLNLNPTPNRNNPAGTTTNPPATITPRPSGQP